MNNMSQLYNDLLSKLPAFAVPLVKILIVWYAAVIFIKIAERFVTQIFSRGHYGKQPVDENKTRTMASLLKSIVRYGTYFVAGVNILDILGINTASLLTAAGIGGLAFSFGAQNLVKDVISGFFIILEDQYNIGDYIEAAGVGGTVEEIGIRTTKLRDFGGQLHTIPNGEITKVTNHSRGAMRAMVTVGVAYEENLPDALEALKSACEEVTKNNQEILVEAPSILGIANLGKTDIEISILAKTIPMQQWNVERQLRKAILEKFGENEIELPYPRMVYIKRESKRGKDN